MINSPRVAISPIPHISAWWAQVTLTPEDNKTTVFRSGTPQGARGLTPVGGHMLPSSTVGASLL